jgi:hypothetical protein
VDVRKLDILIASPGDAKSGRDAVERALYDWNGHRSDSEKLILRPRRWEMDSVPQLGEGDTQTVINSQLVDNSDIVLALFYNRLGTPTDRAISGTAEEILRSVQQGKRVHLYFSQKAMPANVDLEEVEAVRKFRTVMQHEGLVDTFKSEAELSRKIGRAIDLDVQALRARSKSAAAGNPYPGDSQSNSSSSQGFAMPGSGATTPGSRNYSTYSKSGRHFFSRHPIISITLILLALFIMWVFMTVLKIVF